MQKRLRNLRQRTSVFWVLLVSNLVPGVASALILALVFLPMISRTARSTDAAYEQTMLFSAENQFAAVYDAATYITQRIENNDWIHPLYYDLLAGREITHRTRAQIIADLQLFLAQQNDTSAVTFWFYDDPNTVYSNRGIFTNLEFYQAYFPNKLQYFYWPSENGKAGFQTVEFAGESYLLYKTPFRDIAGGRYKGDVNLFFLAEKIGERLSRAAGYDAAGFRITDPEGVVLWEYGTGLFEEETYTISALSDAGTYVFWMEVPKSVHNRTSRTVIPIMVFAVMLDLSLCILMAVVLSRVNYRPFRRIVLKVAGTLSPHNNEFSALEQVIDHIVLEKTETRAILNQLRPLARQKVLGDLLDGTVILDNSFLKNCQLQFNYNRFNVIALEVPFSKLEDGSQDMVITAELAMETLLEYLTGGLALTAYLYDIDRDHYRIIVNYDRQESLTTYAQLLFADCSQCFQDDSVFLGVGQTAFTVEEVYRAANQAESAIRYAVLNNLEQIVFYSEVPLQKSCEYYYPLSEEILFSRAITSCNPEGAKAVLQGIVQANLDTTSRDPISLQRLSQDLISTVRRSGYDMGITLDIRELDHWTPADLNDVQMCVEKLVAQVCGQFLAQQMNPSNSIENRIFAYVDKHIYDPNLSLNGIAAHFNKSSAYISTLFKTQRGTNYSEYVNKARIVRAVELMAKERLDMNKVYPMVGYVSISTFRRNFMKYTKRNPGSLAADFENWSDED